MIQHVNELPPGSTIIVGDCPSGVDWCVRTHAKSRPDLVVEVFEADWATFGKSAGPIRNRRMVERLIDLSHTTEIDAYAFPFGESRGTRNCIQELNKAGVRTCVIEGH